MDPKRTFPLRKSLGSSRLPIQHLTKFELVTLGPGIPPQLLDRADELINKAPVCCDALLRKLAISAFSSSLLGVKADVTRTVLE
jgi:hypothetical protein